MVRTVRNAENKVGCSPSKGSTQAKTELAQSSEARLYTFSQETKDHLRKFRLGTSRSTDPQAVVCTSSLYFE